VRDVERLLADGRASTSVEAWRALLVHDSLWNIDTRNAFQRQLFEILARSDARLSNHVWRLLEEEYRWTEQSMSLYRSLAPDLVDRVMNEIYRALREPPRPLPEVELFRELPASGQTRKSLLRSLWEVMGGDPPPSREPSPDQRGRMRINLAPQPAPQPRPGPRTAAGSMISVWLVIFGLQAVLRMFASMSAPSPTASSRVAEERARAADWNRPDDDLNAAITRVAEANPADPIAQFNLGIVKLNAGDGPGAITSFEKAVALDATMADAYFHLGTLMVGQNKVPEAISYLEKYLAMHPGNARKVATARSLLDALKSSRKPKGVY
jgi:tetratricopeptide (TPR) repeat protein